MEITQSEIEEVDGLIEQGTYSPPHQLLTAARCLMPRVPDHVVVAARSENGVTTWHLSWLSGFDFGNVYATADQDGWCRSRPGRDGRQDIQISAELRSLIDCRRVAWTPDRIRDLNFGGPGFETVLQLSLFFDDGRVDLNPLEWQMSVNMPSYEQFQKEVVKKWSEARSV